MRVGNSPTTEGSSGRWLAKNKVIAAPYRYGLLHLQLQPAMSALQDGLLLKQPDSSYVLGRAGIKLDRCIVADRGSPILNRAKVNVYPLTWRVVPWK